MADKLLLDVKEVASLLGCGRTYVYGMIQRGELPVVKLGRLTRIPVRAVAEFVEGQDGWTRTSSFCIDPWSRPKPR